MRCHITIFIPVRLLAVVVIAVLLLLVIVLCLLLCVFLLFVVSNCLLFTFFACEFLSCFTCHISCFLNNSLKIFILREPLFQAFPLKSLFSIICSSFVHWITFFPFLFAVSVGLLPIHCNSNGKHVVFV